MRRQRRRKEPLERARRRTEGSATKPNLSTIQRSATDPDSLYEIEKSTQDIISSVMQRAQDGGGKLKVPGVEKVVYTGI